MIEKIAAALHVKPYLFFFNELDETDEIAIENPLPEKEEKIPDSTKDELIKNLTTAIRRIIKKIK